MGWMGRAVEVEYLVFGKAFGTISHVILINIGTGQGAKVLNCRLPRETEESRSLEVVKSRDDRHLARLVSQG